MTAPATTPPVIQKRWKVVSPPYKSATGDRIEDLSIYTEDDTQEVIGCSEWMRAEQEVLQYICDLHNKTLAAS